MRTLIFLLLSTICLADPPFVYKATVLEVHDGDTITARIELGFNVSIEKNLRLLDVFAPELSEKDGVRCQKQLQSLIPVGLEVEVKTFKTKSGVDKKSFDRYIAIITYKDRDINTEMANWLTKNKLTGGIGK